MRLFVYGTLTDPACVERVVGRRLPAVPGRLPGYVRVSPADDYPFVLPQDDGEVEGMLLDGLDAAALARLDRYEDAGVLYRRDVAEALVDGVRVPCHVYVGTGIPRRQRQAP